MGLYDMVYASCPGCGTSLAFQSKAGPCSLAEYNLKDAPEAVQDDLDGETKYCESCGKEIRLAKRTKLITYLVLEVEG